MQALYADTCLEAYGMNPGDMFDIFPFNIMLNVGLIIFFLLVEIVLLLDRCRSPASSQCFRFGLPSAPAIVLTCRLGLISNLSIIIEYYLFWSLGHQDAACVTQGFPIAQLVIMITVFVLAFFNVVQFFTRHSLAKACIDVFPPCPSYDKPLCVTSMGTGRGFYATAIGRMLQSSGVVFEMNGVDSWRGEEAWFEANVAHEEFTANIVHASSRLSSVALPPSSQDVCFVPFLSSLPAVGNSLVDNSKTTERRMYKILWEMCRITKKGGLILTWCGKGEAAQIMSMLKRMDCVENICVDKRMYLCISCSPVVLVYATVSVCSASSSELISFPISSVSTSSTSSVGESSPHLSSSFSPDFTRDSNSLSSFVISSSRNNHHNEDETSPSYLFLAILTTFFCLLGVLFFFLSALTDEVWDFISFYPQGVPYDQRISTIMINNLNWFPTMAYCFFPQLYYIQAKNKSVSRIRTLLWASGSVLVELTMAMTAWNALFWLPGFLANLALDHVVSQDAMNWTCMLSLFVFFGGLYLIYNCVQRVSKSQPEAERLLVGKSAS